MGLPGFTAAGASGPQQWIGTRICTFLHIKAHKINTKPADLFLMSTSKSRPQIGKSHEANQLSKLKCFDTN